MRHYDLCEGEGGKMRDISSFSPAEAMTIFMAAWKGLEMLQRDCAALEPKAMTTMGNLIAEGVQVDGLKQTVAYVIDTISGQFDTISGQ